MRVTCGHICLRVWVSIVGKRCCKSHRKEVCGCGDFLSTLITHQLGLQLVCAHVCVCWCAYVCVERRLCSYLFLKEGLRPLWRDKHLEQNESHSPSQPLIPWVRLVSCAHSLSHTHTHLTQTDRHARSRLHTAAAHYCQNNVLNWFSPVSPNTNTGIFYMEFL